MLPTNACGGEDSQPFLQFVRWWCVPEAREAGSRKIGEAERTPVSQRVRPPHAEVQGRVGRLLAFALFF